MPDLCLLRTQELDREQADDVIRTWYVSFLLAGNFSASSPEEVHSKKAIFARTGEHQKKWRFAVQHSVLKQY